jgi:hypothetical protein
MPTAVDHSQDEARFVLITQCIQNDFFLNRECRLRLPDTIVPQMLLGNSDFDLDAGNAPNDKRAAAIENGPFGIFLREALGRRLEDDRLPILHVINVRDWHVPGHGYDVERRAYGRHCEAATWGVQYVDGLERFLDPTGCAEDGEYAEVGAVRVYHVRSDSVFDFKPRAESRDGHRKFRASEIEDVLDLVVQGSDEDLEKSRRLLREGGFGAIHALAQKLDAGDEPRTSRKIYVAVVGVYTDLKVQTLLVGLRTRYDLPNLAVSDTFTASVTLERHLSGLDYASKVLDVEVVHGINDLAGFLGLPAAVEEEGVVARTSFARYLSFFQDKQNVLAFQDEKLRQYLALTEQRSLDVYERIKRTNTFLIFFGCTFLVLTLVFAVLNAFGVADWQIVAITGGVGLVQLVSAFVSKPIRELQQNLTNLAVFKMILESHSLKTALARFHLTTPQTLRELQTEEEAKLAEAQVRILQQQVTAIQEFDTADFADLARLALALGDGGPAAESVSATNGAAAAATEEVAPE